MKGRRRWHPSLAQRVFATVVLAFVVVLLALQAYMYIGFRNSLAVDQGLSRLGRSLALVLSSIDDEAQARAVVVATETLYQTLRISGNPAGTLRFQLRDAQGRQVYATPALRGQVLGGTPAHVVTQAIDGESYWVYRNDAARWSLRLAEPERTLAKVLPNNLRVVLPYLLLAFPIVLLPVWFAVRHGLRPLRQLAEAIGRRGSSDLSPIGLDPPHAELKPLTSALERLLRQLRERMARERAFVQEAAHELRTPMAVIAAQAHALAGAASTEDRREAQAHLEHAIARASHLTQQLLELATLDDAGAGTPRRTDLAQLARQLLAQAAPRALGRGIELALEAPDSLVAEVEVPAFQSILENLLDNAIRYVHDGARVAVTLHEEPGGRLRLSVEDDGPGIAAAERERVFERFYRGTAHETAGSGLGLAIVRQAVVRLHGELRVREGLAGRGVGFDVRLPGRRDRLA